MPCPRVISQWGELAPGSPYSDRMTGVDTYRWTNRLHSPDRDAAVAADRTSDVMARILEELRMLDDAELGLGRQDSPAAAFAAGRLG